MSRDVPGHPGTSQVCPRLAVPGQSWHLGQTGINWDSDLGHLGLWQKTWDNLGLEQKTWDYLGLCDR